MVLGQPEEPNAKGESTEVKNSEGTIAEKKKLIKIRRERTVA